LDTNISGRTHLQCDVVGYDKRYIKTHWMGRLHILIQMFNASAFICLEFKQSSSLRKPGKSGEEHCSTRHPSSQHSQRPCSPPGQTSCGSRTCNRCCCPPLGKPTHHNSPFLSGRAAFSYHILGPTYSLKVLSLSN